jgi:hypothetical protein
VYTIIVLPCYIVRTLYASTVDYCQANRTLQSCRFFPTTVRDDIFPLSQVWRSLTYVRYSFLLLHMNNSGTRMPPRKSPRATSSTRNSAASSRPGPYDLTLPANLSRQQLTDKLLEFDIIVPASLSKAQLQAIYEKSANRRATTQNLGPAAPSAANVTSISSDPTQNVQNVFSPSTYFPLAEGHTPPVRAPAVTDLRSETAARMNTEPALSTQNSVPVPIFDVNNMAAATNTLPTTMPSMMQSFQQTVCGLQQTVASLLTVQQQQSTSTTAPPTFTLEQVYAGNTSTPATTNFAAMSQPSGFGVPAESLPYMDTISNSLRKQIIQGKDVNLATLITPYYDSTPSTCHGHEYQKEDQRIKNQSLNFKQFIQAFGRYKRAMCKAFPNRMEELDQYLAHIVDVNQAYGDRFYEYHKLFSLRAANALEQFGIKVDWSKGDRTLLQLIIGGAKSNYCALCGEVSHEAAFCHLQTDKTQTQRKPSAPANRSASSETDIRGRRRHFSKGGEICNNFNTFRGCTRAGCSLQHVCVICKVASHGQAKCPRDNEKAKASPGTDSDIKTA